MLLRLVASREDADRLLLLLALSVGDNCLGGGGAAAGPGGKAGSGGGALSPFTPNGPAKREVEIVSERQEGNGGAGVLGGGLVS